MSKIKNLVQKISTSIIILFALSYNPSFSQVKAKDLLKKRGQLIYENSLSNQDLVKEWVMEGPGVIKFKDGWMEMSSPDEKWHHVFWCPRIFPTNFIAEWDVRVLKREGLAIVFLAATGKKRQSIFASNLPKRDGTFKYYNRGKINCYHISYYANNPKHPKRGNSHLRKDPGSILLQSGKVGISVGSSTEHHICLIKNEGHIIMYVDNRKIIDYMDKGKNNGPIYHLGNIGFRQMRWTDMEYKDFKVWALKNQTNK